MPLGVRFGDVFKGYGKRLMAWDGLFKQLLFSAVSSSSYLEVLCKKKFVLKDFRKLPGKYLLTQISTKFTSICRTAVS